ncbi:hypothetical protein [Paraburkholderia sp. DGU8]|uniref:hypothetical protein n=1 Tax=Paraburkholderia sp. DGU8 TaxID=3161997 RepID=UPI003465A190
MSGITVIATTSNVAAALSSWNTLVQTIKSFSSGNASQDDVKQAGATFIAAASALKSSEFAQTFSGIAGFATSMANWNTDLAREGLHNSFSDRRPFTT